MCRSEPISLDVTHSIGRIAPLAALLTKAEHMRTRTVALHGRGEQSA